MSYILDALKKSEQQRQAIQPDTVNERILVNTISAEHKPNKWLIAMIAFNLLALSGLTWFMFKRYGHEVRQKIGGVSSMQNVRPPQAEPVYVKKSKAAINSDIVRYQENAAGTVPSEMSLERMLEEKSSAEKTAEPMAKIQDPLGKKPALAKKEKIAADSSGQKKPKPVLDAGDSGPQVQPIVNAPQKEFAGLSPVMPSGSPKLTINVFSYAQKPEDRFVIIDMVKYKIGQQVKRGVKLKEIRSDSIVLEDSKGTFTVDRP